MFRRFQRDRASTSPSGGVGAGVPVSIYATVRPTSKITRVDTIAQPSAVHPATNTSTKINGPRGRRQRFVRHLNSNLSIPSTTKTPFFPRREVSPSGSNEVLPTLSRSGAFILCEAFDAEQRKQGKNRVVARRQAFRTSPSEAEPGRTSGETTYPTTIGSLTSPPVLH